MEEGPLTCFFLNNFDCQGSGFFGDLATVILCHRREELVEGMILCGPQYHMVTGEVEFERPSSNVIIAKARGPSRRKPRGAFFAAHAEHNSLRMRIM